MERKLIETKDGSHSIAIPEWDVTYHSVHGAIQESMHVFIKAGLEKKISDDPGRPLRILEMGFGTGLNALLTLLYATTNKVQIDYTTVEKFPLGIELVERLNYCGELNCPELKEQFSLMHKCKPGEAVEINSFFSFTRLETDLSLLPEEVSNIDLIYFDAFAPTAQPELWTGEIFHLLWQRCNRGAVLTTYCSKGVVRRNMEAAGWKIEKIPGPPGKREMVRATK